MERERERERKSKVNRKEKWKMKKKKKKEKQLRKIMEKWVKKVKNIDDNETKKTGWQEEAKKKEKKG